MKQRLIYFVKHSPLIKAIYVGLGSLLLRFLGLFVPIQQNLVLIVPNTGRDFSGSPKDIFDYMKIKEDYKNFSFVIALNTPEEVVINGAQLVKFDSFKYFMTSLKAKYWITDINVERGLHYKKRGTKFLNTWHGVALKKIGNDDPKSARYNYKDVDYLCVSGAYDKKVYKSALNAQEKSFLEVGMPRNDRLFAATPKEKNALRHTLNIPEGKKVLLYVPTWRDSQDRGKSYALDVQADFTYWQEKLGKDYVLLFRAHSRTTKLMNLEFNDFLRDYSEYPDLNDLLIVADVLITDYSSVVCDYAILEKPAICFGYDYEAYQEERGFYIDLDEVFPNGIYKDQNQVIEYLETMSYNDECQKTRAIKQKFMEYSQGKATQLCVEALFASEKA